MVQRRWRERIGVARMEHDPDPILLEGRDEFTGDSYGSAEAVGLGVGGLHGGRDVEREDQTTDLGVRRRLRLDSPPDGIGGRRTQEKGRKTEEYEPLDRESIELSGCQSGPGRPTSERLRQDSTAGRAPPLSRECDEGEECAQE
jgi:hypothetical protein